MSFATSSFTGAAVQAKAVKAAASRSQLAVRADIYPEVRRAREETPAPPGPVLGGAGRAHARRAVPREGLNAAIAVGETHRVAPAREGGGVAGGACRTTRATATPQGAGLPQPARVRPARGRPTLARRVHTRVARRQGPGGCLRPLPTCVARRWGGSAALGGAPPARRALDSPLQIFWGAASRVPIGRRGLCQGAAPRVRLVPPRPQRPEGAIGCR